MARAKQDDLDEELDDLDKELAREASKDTARSKARGGGTLGGPSDKVSVKDKRFSMGDTLLDKDTKGRSFKGVLLNFAFVNEYYASKFDKNKPAAPVCWALSEDGEEMAPHKNSAETQSDECADCPMNEWGSGTDDGNKRGRKACKQGLRIALVHVDDIADAGAAEEAVIGFIPLPPTSTAPFNKYLDELAELGRPMYSVVTEFSFDEDYNYAVVNYAMDEKLKDRDVIDALKARRDEAMKKIMTPYNKLDAKEDEDEKPRKKRRVEEDDGDERPRRKLRAVEEDEDEDPPPRKKKRATAVDDADEGEDPPVRKKRKADEDEDPPSRSRRKKAAEEDEEAEEDDEDDEDAEDEKPVKRRGSRFGGK